MKQLERVSIESLCEKVTSGGTPSRAVPHFWEHGEIPWFKTGELRDWYLEDAEEKITEEALAASSAKLFPPNTVLMAMYGDGRTITSLGILKEEAATNQACCAMIVDPVKCHHLYLFYALKYHRQEILTLVVAGAQRNLGSGIIKGFKIVSRPLCVQERIVELISVYDDLIENNRRRMALLEEAARQLYREWFIRLRFPGHEHTRITNGVPEGWERRRLGNLCEEVRETVRPDTLDPHTPYIGLEHMPRRSISLNEWGTVEQVISSKHRFQEGDILFGKIRPYFHKVGVAFVNGVASSDAIIIRPLEARVRGVVLMTVSSDPFVAATAQAMKEGSKMPRADWKQMQQNVVPLPPDGLLQSFEDMIRIIVEQLKTLTLACRHLKAARDLLLPRLMSGELAV